MKKILIVKSFNRNESKIHYELKQIAKYVLYNKGYNCIATEVQFSKYNKYLKSFEWFNDRCISKNTIDTVGIKGNLANMRDSAIEKYKLMGIEAKASYNDFLNGFCCQCEYTYIIAPKGIIPIDKVPEKIGLIEVDIENYEIKFTKGIFTFTGIEVIKQCTSRKKDIYRGREDLFRIDMFNSLRRIAYRSTMNDIYKKNEILIKGFKIRKES